MILISENLKFFKISPLKNQNTFKLAIIRRNLCLDNNEFCVNSRGSILIDMSHSRCFLLIGKGPTLDNLMLLLHLVTEIFECTQRSTPQWWTSGIFSSRFVFLLGHRPMCVHLRDNLALSHSFIMSARRIMWKCGVNNLDPTDLLVQSQRFSR